MGCERWSRARLLPCVLCRFKFVLCVLACSAVSSPEQLAGAVVDPSPAVVVPLGQLWHSGLALAELPPADHVPTAHVVQLGPPVPAEQAAVTVRVQRAWTGVAPLFKIALKLGWHTAQWDC